MLFPRVQRLRAGSRLWRVRAGALGGSHAENDYRGLLGRIGGDIARGDVGGMPVCRWYGLGGSLRRGGPGPGEMPLAAPPAGLAAAAGRAVT